jgi:hypothetical protein
MDPARALSLIAVLGLGACAPGEQRPMPKPITASASELPPRVADAVLCYQAGIYTDRLAYELDIRTSPTERGILLRGIEASQAVLDDYYGPAWGPVAESDANVLMQEYLGGFVDANAAADPIRASAANYMHGNKILAACQRVR